MGRSGRARVAIGITLTAAVAVLGLAGCAREDSGGSGAVTDEALTELSWEAQALESIGFAPADLVPAGLAVADPAPTASASPDRKGDRRDGIRRHKRLRFAFGRNMLHGEAVVQTAEGVRTRRRSARHWQCDPRDLDHGEVGRRFHAHLDPRRPDPRDRAPHLNPTQ